MMKHFTYEKSQQIVLNHSADFLKMHAYCLHMKKYIGTYTNWGMWFPEVILRWNLFSGNLS